MVQGNIIHSPIGLTTSTESIQAKACAPFFPSILLIILYLYTYNWTGKKNYACLQKLVQELHKETA
jgi:hypothetical protein